MAEQASGWIAQTFIRDATRVGPDSLRGSGLHLCAALGGTVLRKMTKYKQFNKKKNAR
jgi:hypothetical protein